MHHQNENPQCYQVDAIEDLISEGNYLKWITGVTHLKNKLLIPNWRVSAEIGSISCWEIAKEGYGLECQRSKWLNNKGNVNAIYSWIEGVA
jgi:hypothetical protein